MMGATHHFIIDFMKMDLADFLHHILNFKCYKAKTCREDKGAERKMVWEKKEGKETGKREVGDT